MSDPFERLYALASRLFLGRPLTPIAPASKLRVVICGAGIGGLTAAVALSQYPDINVEVYESAAELAEVGAGIGVFPRPWGIMKKLGVGDELLELGGLKPHEGPVPFFRCRKSDQSEGLKFHTILLNGNLLLLHRADFQKVLIRKLPQSCKIHVSKRLRSYTQKPSGPIELLFEDGSTTTCDVLIGADGLKSAVRKSFMREKADLARSEGRLDKASEYEALTDPVWSGIVAYRTLIPTERLRERAPDHPSLSEPTLYSGKDNYIVTYPIASGKLINFVGLKMQHDREGTPFDGPWALETEGSEFASRFVGWEPRVLDLVTSIDKALRWAIHIMNPLDSFVSGRVVLIGDAAHAMTPSQGSGAGQAIEDAFFLATLLGHPATTMGGGGETLDRALDAFDRVRRPMAQEVWAKSRLCGRLFSFHESEVGKGGDAELEKELSEVSETARKLWAWTWVTSTDEAMGDAVRLLEGK